MYFMDSWLDFRTLTFWEIVGLSVLDPQKTAKLFAEWSTAATKWNSSCVPLLALLACQDRLVKYINLPTDLIKRSSSSLWVFTQRKTESVRFQGRNIKARRTSWLGGGVGGGFFHIVAQKNPFRKPSIILCFWASGTLGIMEVVATSPLPGGYHSSCLLLVILVCVEPS